MNSWHMLLVLAGGLTLAACSAPVAPREQPAPDQGPRRGGQMNVRVATDPFDWDSSYAGKSVPNDQGVAYATNSLLGFKSGPDVGYSQMILRPELAEKWEVSADARTFTFHLRRGVKFVNLPPVNGRELTSADVKWTYEYWTRTGEFKDKKLPQGQFDYMFEGMTGVETPDPYTAVVRFKEPFVPFLAYTASEWDPIMAKEVYQQDLSLKDHLIGTGAFYLDTAASQKGSRWVWKKNPDYWDAGKPYLDEVRWLVLPDEATLHAAFTAKQLDTISQIAYQDAKTVEASNPLAKLTRVVQPRGYHLYFSQAHPGPLKDVRVRQALTLSVDREEINRGVSGGLGTWAVPGAMAGLFTDQEAHALQPQDTARAKTLLAQAGYDNGFPLDWPYQADETKANVAWYQLIQAQFKRVGVTINLPSLDKATQRARKYAGEYDLDSGVGLGGLEADIDSMLYGPYFSASSGNWSKINDSELDTLLQSTRRETNPAKRQELLKASAKRIVDQAWGIELIYPPIWYAAQPWVEGFYPQFGNRAEHIEVWLNK